MHLLSYGPLTRALTVVLMALGAFLWSGCGPDQTRTSSAQITVSPSPAEFPATPVGDVATETLVIESVGDGLLQFESVSIVEGADVYSFEPAIPSGYTLESGELLTIRVSYAPTEVGTREGVLRFETNALNTNDGILDVELRPAATDAVLLINPDPVNFGRVQPGTSMTEPVTIANGGTAGVEILRVFVSGSADFELEELEFDVPQVLAPDAFVTASITYTPDSDGADDGVLVVEHRREGSNDDPISRIVNISANGTEPCINVTHEDGYDFGQRMVGRTGEEVFTISNCGDEIRGQTLAISGMEWSEPHDWFSFSAPDGLDAPLDLDLLDQNIDVELEPGEYRTFIVGFAPGEDESAVATLRIDSNDPLKSPLDIEIRGVGTNNQCPTAAPVCEVRGIGVPSDEVAAIPLDFLDCTGSNSTDDGTVESYQWRVMERPDGSTAEFTPNASEMDTSFFLDLAGRYVFELDVVDNEGALSCDPGQVIVTATPNEAILVELTWDTPTDDDQTDDTGTDLDIHLVHSDYEWGDPVYDTFWRNPEPNWGSTTRGDDNPSLDIDDTDGAGPEDINLDNPEGGVTYRAGVHYFNDRGFGISYATVRIFINGAEAFAREGRPLDNSDNEIGKDLWEVATIEWPTGEIYELGDVIDWVLPVVEE